MKPTLDGTGKNFIMGIETCAFRWKAFMLFQSSRDLFIMKHAFVLQILDFGFPLLYHLLNLALSRRALQLFRYIPKAFLEGSLESMEEELKGVEVVLCNMSWYGIQTGPYDFPVKKMV